MSSNNSPGYFGAPANNVPNQSTQSGFSVKILFQIVNDATASVKAKLRQIAARRSAIAIGDMFEMQMLMNHLSQLSEMSTNVIYAANTSIMSMARNVKG